jgi:tartrate-resistant acid phosphatase type 5
MQHRKQLSLPRSTNQRGRNFEKATLDRIRRSYHPQGTLAFAGLLFGLLLCMTLFARFPVASAQQSTVRFAVVGDFGLNNIPEGDVAKLVKSWNPDFVITVGDNNYPDGAASTIDANIGQYYHDFIFPYSGIYGQGATTNRFFPSLGNHDWVTPGAQPYLDYFVLPNNERYYDFVKGPVHFYAIDSDPHEPDGNTSTSTQATWLNGRLVSATEPWKIVYFHHPPYSSGAKHGSSAWMQWPFQQWGATAVLAGHEHDYERIVRSGFPYFVNGLGGADLYTFGTPVTGSQVRYNSNYGAMLVEASSTSITFKFINRAGALIDSYTINSGSAVPAVPLSLTASTIVSSRIDLKWTDTSSNEDGFKVERCKGAGCTNFAQIAQLGPNVTTYGNSGLTAGTSYAYRVRAFNGIGNSGFSNTARATTPLFSDSFNDSTRDTSKWKLGRFSRPSTYFDPQVAVSELNGRLTITPLASVAGTHYNGYVSVSTWNLTGRLAAVEVPQKSAGVSNTVFSVGVDADNWYAFKTEGTQLRLERRVAGVTSSVAITYSATTHRYWRIRHIPSSDSIVFETSSNGSSWTIRRTVARQIPITAVLVEMVAGTSESVSSPGQALFDNFHFDIAP